MKKEFSEDSQVIEFRVPVDVVYVLDRYLNEGIDTVSCEGILDLSKFGNTKKQTLASIQLPIQEMISFAKEILNYCETSSAPKTEEQKAEEKQKAKVIPETRDMFEGKDVV